MLTQINVDKLHPHPQNPRLEIGDIAELTESIKANGILQNLTVVPFDGEYRVIIGHRRLAAAKAAGMTEVPCNVVELTEKEQIGMMLSENIQRCDLTIYEQAQSFQLLLDLEDGDIKKVSDATGFSESTVRRRVRLATLNKKDFKESEKRGITLADYERLFGVDDEDERNKLLKVIGTDKFEREIIAAKIRCEKKRNRDRIVAAVEEFAERIETSDWQKHEFIRSYSYDDKTIVENPANGRKRFYVENTWGVTLYKEKGKKKPTPEQLEREKKREDCDKRKAMLTSIVSAAQRRHVEYICAMSKTEAERLKNHALEKLIDLLIEDGTIDDEVLEEMFDMDADGLTAEQMTAKTIIILVFCAITPGMSFRPYITWRDTEVEQTTELHHFREEMELMEAIGYTPEEDERATAEGTSYLYDTD